MSTMQLGWYTTGVKLLQLYLGNFAQFSGSAYLS